MMRRKLQTVGWMAALLLSAVLWTMPAMAEEVKYELWIAGKQLTSENCQNIDKDHGFSGVTIADGGECRYDNEKRTLFMKNVTIEAGDGHSAVANGSIFNLRIQLEGKNYLKTTNRSALYNGAEVMVIKGEEGKAELVVTSRDSAAVCVKETVSVEYIDFTATGKWGVLGKNPTHPLCNFALHFAKGTITATGAEENECAVSNVYEMGYDDVLIREPIITPTDGGYKWPNKFFADQTGKKVKKIAFDRKYPLNITTGYVDVDNCNNIPADPQFKYITVADGGHLYYRHDIKTLFMKDVTIESDRLVCAIMNDGIEGLTIHLEGKNIWSVEQKGIVCLASTKITGNGTLTLTIRPNAYSLCGFGIEPNKDHPNVTVDVSDITIEAHTPILLHSDPSKTTGKYILNNVKATVHGALKNCECTFKGCKIVSAEGASPIEIDRIRVESLSFSPAELIRYVGDAPAAVPQPTVNPEDAGNKRMKWTSDNEEVAKVDEEGMLIIGKKGTAHLTAKTTDGSNQEATLTVQVRYRVDGVKLFQNDQEVSAITVTEGAPFTLTAKVVPETTPGGVEWEFQAEEFTVTDKTTEKATFTALKTGDYTLTAKAVEDNTKTAMVNVKVLLATPTAIAIAEAEKNFELKKDESKEITLNFTPAEHVNKEVNVTVAPKEALAASVTDGKLTIKADKPFDKDTQVTVTVTSKVAPTVSASCTVTLKYEKPGAVEDVALESMVVAPNPFTSQLRISNPEGVEARYELVNTIGVVVRKGALQSVETVLNYCCPVKTGYRIFRAHNP
ncbi:MAG: Ig domain-containing protein [Bacteroides sp.]